MIRRSKPSRLAHCRCAARAGTPVSEKLGRAARVMVPLVLAVLLITAAAAAPGPRAAAPRPWAGEPLAAQAQQREVRRTFAAGEGTIVDLENLAGSITIEGISGGQVEIVATVNAESGRRADAETLLGLLTVELDERARRIEVRADYPVERFTRYRYPNRGQRRGTFNSQTRYQDERVTVTSRDDDDAVTLWVDFTLRVPPGVSVDVENEHGDVAAAGLQGDLRADTAAGNVSVVGGRGRVEADTGSGTVIVSDYTGDVTADTGSGRVEVTGVTGDVTADTGSGSITLRRIEAQRVSADTGSGDIELEEVSGEINADTGSGDITGSNLRVGATLLADTGSGDVRFSGDMSGVRQIEIDTSSGDVELDMSAFPGMRITIETGSGGISVDLPGLNTVRSRRNSFRGEVGDGSAEVVIDTGSGSVRIRGI